MNNKLINLVATAIPYILIIVLSSIQKPGGPCSPSVGIYILLFFLPIAIFINLVIQGALYKKGDRSGSYALWLNLLMILGYIMMFAIM